MRTLGWVVAGALAAAVMGTPVRAADMSAAKPTTKTTPTLKEMTLIGTVDKVENKKKDGSPMMTWYTLTGDDGIVAHLPKGKVEEFVGSKVKLVGMGYDTVKHGKPAKTIESISSIEKVDSGK